MTLNFIIIQEDEIEAWNRFLRDLRRVCIEKRPGNKSFWSRVTEIGREVSLISTSEAKKQGGKSSVSDTQADEVSPLDFAWVGHNSDIETVYSSCA